MMLTLLFNLSRAQLNTYCCYGTVTLQAYEPACKHTHFLKLLKMFSLNGCYGPNKYIFSFCPLCLITCSPGLTQKTRVITLEAICMTHS